MKVIKASKFVVTLLVILFTVSLSAVSEQQHTALIIKRKDSARTRKKINGNKSAKHYAPG
jgi:hypothetical protein